MICNKVVIFYERHDEPQATKTLVELLPLLKKIDVNSVCLEEPNDVSFQDKVLNYQRNIEFLSKCVNVKSLESSCAQRVLRANILGDKEGNPIRSSDIKTFSLTEQESVLAAIKEFFVANLEAAKQNFELITKISQYNFSYCAMDLPEDERVEHQSKNYKAQDGYDIRSLYMRDKILEQCDKNGDVVLMVGASHFKLAQLLENAGVKHIYEYYIVNSPKATNFQDIAENCIRSGDHSHIEYCNNYHFNGMTLDLHEEPGLNTTQLVGNHLIISEILNGVN